MRHHPKRSFRSRSGADLQQAGSATTASEAARPVAALFEEALQFHRNGELERAGARYQEILSRAPDHADALHMLGFAAFQTRQFDESVTLIQQALVLRPEEGEYHANLALALFCTGNADLAIHHVSQANDCLDPTSLVHVGFELYESNRLDAAQTCFELALSMVPHLPEALNFLGMVHKKAGRHDAAVASYEAALEHRPGYCEVLINLGNAYRDAENVEKALEYYHAAIDANPNVSAVHNNLGVAYSNQARFEDAIASFNRAIHLDPNSVDAHNNLGNSLREIGQLHEAEAHFLKACQLAPCSSEILSNYGTMLLTDHRPGEAIARFHQSLEHGPDTSKVITNLAAAMCDIGEYAAAESQLIRAAELVPTNRLAELRARQVCPVVFPNAHSMEHRWHTISTLVEDFRQAEIPFNLAEMPYEVAAPPFNLQFFNKNLRDVKAAYAAAFWKLHERGPVSRPRQGSTQRYRIGMVVTAGHEGIFLKSLSGVVARLNAEQFEVVVFCSQGGLGRVKRAFGDSPTQLRTLPSRLDLAANIISDTNLDLLYYFEIGTDANNYFLPFFRLAPVQCTSWGIQVTSGIPTVDYYLSNSLVERHDAQEHYTERLELADSLLCYRYRTNAEGMPSRKRFGFESCGSVYLCAQQPGKFHPDFDATLLEILSRNEQAILALTADQHGHAARSLKERFRVTMSSVFDQIVFLPRLGAADYASLIRSSDVLLDPPYFVGVNSTYDGLSFGKPIVTCPSPFHRGRYTFGCYRRMNIDSCVATDTAEYVELACRLGKDSDLRHEIGEEIAERSHLLFEDPAAVSEHERLFAELIERHSRQ